MSGAVCLAIGGWLVWMLWLCHMLYFNHRKPHSQQPAGKRVAFDTGRFFHDHATRMATVARRRPMPPLPEVDDYSI